MPVLWQLERSLATSIATRIAANFGGGENAGMLATIHAEDGLVIKENTRHS